MNEDDPRDGRLQIALELQAAGGPDTLDGPASRLLAGFTEAERRRLTFLRWLYRQGRLVDRFSDGIAERSA